MDPAYRKSRTIPSDKIWCSRCTQFRPATAFSNTRLTRATLLLDRGSRMGDARVVSTLFCNNCSGGPRTELFCTGSCHRLYPLDQFSSVQRSQPDTARCKTCVAEIENVKAGHYDPEAEDDEDDAYKASINGSDANSLGSTVGGVSLTPSNGFEALPSASRSSPATPTPTSATTSVRSCSARSFSATSSRARPPPVQVGASGFARVKSGHKDVPVPEKPDDEVTRSDDEDDYSM